jgi:hypothetical protein
VEIWTRMIFRKQKSAGLFFLILQNGKVMPELPEK